MEADAREEHGMVGQVAVDELRQAVAGVALPPLITWDRDGIIRLANNAAAETLGLPLDEVVGKSLVELAGPVEDIERTINDFNSGRFVGVHSHRSIHVGGSDDRLVLATSRAIRVDGLLGGVTVFVPESEVGGLGRDPRRTWLDLVPVAVGGTDADWTIESVSSEIQDLIDRTSSEVRGRILLELVDPADVDELRGSATAQHEPRSLSGIRFLLPRGDEVEVCVLLAPLAVPYAGMRFALVGNIESYFPQQQDRIADLELRLQRIGAEVRAAGLLDTAETSAFQDHPEISGLSTRQWEILSRLLEGARVSTIATELLISPSTVRNHLSTIFQRFGVHSQAELIDRFRQPRNN
ncbi:MAG TPA: LuxR C-terminal-related transcriptional regulator [Acidimicrobiales bacterium]|nr:LuxR C-terminal-related transcriptional regulator [Acidimicrobiales bacterium]